MRHLIAQAGERCREPYGHAAGKMVQIALMGAIITSISREIDISEAAT